MKTIAEKLMKYSENHSLADTIFKAIDESFLYSGLKTGRVDDLEADFIFKDKSRIKLKNRIFRRL